MYNCIRSRRRLPDTADRSRFYAVKLKLLYPGIFFIPYSSAFFYQHSVKRHINSSYLRFFTKIVCSKLRTVSVGKAYRHLRFGGIASGTRVISQKHDVLVSEHCHICDSIVVEFYHSFTKCSSLPCFLMSFTTSRVLINTVAVLSHGCMPISLFSKSLSI